MEEADFRYLPWSIPPIHTNHTTTHSIQICLAWAKQAGGDFGQSPAFLVKPLKSMHQHIKAPFQTFYVPGRRFDHIHIDLVCPLPPSEGFTHLLTVVDLFTRRPEAIPLRDTYAATCAQVLVKPWISRFGVPMHITSDRGTQFTSQLWVFMWRSLLGTQLHQTKAYHPQSNGLEERFHRHREVCLAGLFVWFKLDQGLAMGDLRD